MTREEFGALLNTLLEAERAGAKLLAAYVGEASPSSELHAALQSVQRDEARNCAVLIHLLLEADVAPSTATGNFYDRGLAIDGWAERLAFLNRGQGWVAKRIGEALGRVPELSAKYTLQTMHESHLENIRACEEVLAAVRSANAMRCLLRRSS